MSRDDTGFVFGFDEDEETSPSQGLPPAPVAMEPHPLESTPVLAMLEKYAATSTEKVNFGELFLVPGNVRDGATEKKSAGADADDSSLLHVVGVHVDHLECLPVDEDDEETQPARRDIVPNHYLGGLKVWSCAEDLARIVYRAGTSKWIPPTLPSSASPMQFMVWALRDILLRHRLAEAPPARVLELGCGHGLPGLAALACGALDVAFHDFNQEAIEHCLLPNLCASFRDGASPVAATRRPGYTTAATGAVVRAGSGPWNGFAPCSDDGLMTFDLILGADVTYDDATTTEFLRTVSRVLAPGGRCFVGTKRLYFGTGGGLQAIYAAVEQSEGHLVVDADVPVTSDGGSMPRHVVVLRAP